MSLPQTVTPRASGFSRRPPHAGHGPLRHEALDLRAHVVGLGVLVAAHQVGYDALVGSLPRELASALGAVAHGELVVPVAVENEVGDRLRQFPKWGVDGEVVSLGQRVEHAQVKAVGRARPHPGSDGAVCQRLFRIGHHEFRVDLQLEAEAGALRACAVRVVEAEGARLNLAEADGAVRAGELLGEDDLRVAARLGLAPPSTSCRRRFRGRGVVRRSVGQDGDGHHAFGEPHGCFQRLVDAALLQVLVDDEAVHDDLDGMPVVLVEGDGLGKVADCAVNLDADKALLARVLKDVLVLALAVADDGRHQHDAAVPRQVEDGVGDLLDGLLHDRSAALGAVGLADAGEEEPEVVVHLGDGADG